MRRTGWLAGLSVAVILVALAAGCAGAGGGGVQRGKKALDFSLPALGGAADNLSNYRGHTVLLNFFTTWCGPCRAEMPDMQAVYGELRDQGLVIVGVNQGESAEKVAAFAREFGLTFPILLDEKQQIGEQYGVRSYPTTLIVDADGVIRQVIVGGPLTRTALRRELEGLLK